MSQERDDGDLRTGYERLRRQDEILARPFAAVRQAAARQAGQDAEPARTQAPARVPGRRQTGAAGAGAGQTLPRRRQLHPAWLAAAALVVVLAAGIGVFDWLRPRPARPGAPAALTQITRLTQLIHWRSPTASLLRTPGSEILRGVPRLGAAAPITTATFFGGDERK